MTGTDVIRVALDADGLETDQSHCDAEDGERKYDRTFDQLHRENLTHEFSKFFHINLHYLIKKFENSKLRCMRLPTIKPKMIKI